MALSANSTDGGPDSAGFWRSAVFRYFAVLALVLLVALAAFLAFSLYEYAVLGEHQLAMRKPPIVTPYYLGRLVAILLLSLVIAVAMYRWRGGDSAIGRAMLSSFERRVAWGLLAGAAACTALFTVDPLLFNQQALEDSALEWVSALLPLAASAGFAYAFVHVLRAPPRDGRRRVTLLLCPLFAFVLFVIGMEEISWMQRVFGIATPDLFAENQQREMNLHNMHSIVFGQTHKAAMFAALILAPFIVDTAPRNRLFDWLADFLPSRFILVVSAPWAGMNYNEWNFTASQMYVTLTLVILACYVKAAWQRRDRAELALFAAIAVFIVIAQPLYLGLGHQFVRMWDASEYVELFMAIGLAIYTWQTIARLRARYGAAQGAAAATP